MVGLLIGGTTLAIMYVQESEGSSDQTLKESDKTIEGVKYKVSLSDGIGTTDYLK